MENVNETPRYHRRKSNNPKYDGQLVVCPATKRCRNLNFSQEQYEGIQRVPDLIAADISHRRELMTLTGRQDSLRKLQREITAAEEVARIVETRPLEPISDWGDMSLIEDSEEVLERVKELTEKGDIDEMEAFLKERGEDPKFIALTKLRDETYERLEQTISEESLLYNYAMNDLSDEAKASYGDFEYSLVMERTDAVRELKEEYAVIQKQLNIYKNANAIVAYEIGKLHDEEGIVPIYDEERIGNFVETIDYPSGSREWLEERQKGFGGSDIGPIAAKLNPQYFVLGQGEPTKYLNDNYRDVINSKIDEITDEEVEEQTRAQTDFTNPSSRGNAWEGYIFHKFRQNNPDINVGECKKSWVKEDDSLYRANFDGILLDENGVPDGILEIKTSGIPGDWGDTSEGIYGVPPQYQAQTLHYAIEAGMKRGVIAVVIDDNDYREYHFDIDDTMRAHAANNVVAMHKAAEIVEQQRQAGPAVYKGFSGGLLKEIENSKDSAFETPAAYRGESVAQTKQLFRSYLEDAKEAQITSIQSAKPRKPRNATEEQLALYNSAMADHEQYLRENANAVEVAYRNLFTSQNPAHNTQQYVSVDIETNDLTPARGQIIEVGISATDARGNETAKLDKLYGLTPKAAYATGTGAEHVHHISMDMVEGKSTFRSPKESKEVLEMFLDKTLIAHNAAYEKTWFRKQVPGFVEAERAGRIRFLDTMKMARYFTPDQPTNKLRDFTKDNGVEYVDAHRAYNDAEMTKDALANLRTRLYTTGR